MMWRRGTGATSDAGKDGAEQHRHSDHARRNKLKIATAAGLLENRSQAETESQQVEQRLA
jgi:hypothetical protein